MTNDDTNEQRELIYITNECDENVVFNVRCVINRNTFDAIKKHCERSRYDDDVVDDERTIAMIVAAFYDAVVSFDEMLCDDE